MEIWKCLKVVVNLSSYTEKLWEYKSNELMKEKKFIDND